MSVFMSYLHPYQAKLGLSLMKLAFSLESWEACGGDATLSGIEALREGNQHIDAALKIFKEVRGPLKVDIVLEFVM